MMINTQSQSLCFQGWLLTMFDHYMVSRAKVSIPLFSGLVTDFPRARNAAKIAGLNPFVFRAGY